MVVPVIAYGTCITCGTVVKHYKGLPLTKYCSEYHRYKYKRKHDLEYRKLYLKSKRKQRLKAKRLCQMPKEKFTLSIVKVGLDAVVVLGYDTESAAQKAVQEMCALVAKNGKLTIEIKTVEAAPTIDAASTFRQG
jgi:hypothetical protein